MLDDVTGDLFAGETTLFFIQPRRSCKSPFRIETAAAATELDGAPLSFRVHVSNPDMILLCDSRFDAVRVAASLRASDIGIDTSVPAYDPDNAGRWTNLRTTSDGRHWSDGEHNLRRRPDSGDRIEESSSPLSRLVAQLPPPVAEAVREGRSVVISRTANLLSGRARLSARRLCKTFGNYVYALWRCREGRDGPPTGGEVVAFLIVGRFWPKDVIERPVLTVARRKRRSTTAKGGRVFCMCLGNHLAKSLARSSVEEVARSKRHYEGYFDETHLNTLSDGNSSRRDVLASNE